MRKLLAVAVAMFPALAFAAIVNSAHDLTASTLINFGTTNGARYSCSFCHGAHHTASTLGLWVRGTPGATGAGWTVTTQTSLGTALPGKGATNHGTQECLSCHDGSIALNTTQYYPIAGVLNDPATTGTIGGAAAGTDIGNLDATNHLVGGSSAFPALEGTHPVSVAYPPVNAQAGTYYTVATSGCTAIGAGFCVTNPNLPAAGLATKIVRQAGGNYTVECTSCHDPHVGGIFLRPMPSGSNRCAACHNK